MRVLVRAIRTLAVLAAFLLPASASALTVDAALWSWPVSSGQAPKASFSPFGPDSRAGSVAVYDLGADGITEIMIGAGYGKRPLVRAFRSDGSVIFEFDAYDPGMLQGVNVAAGDLNGDRIAELITGTAPGAAGHVRLFDNWGKERFIAGGFFPYGPEFLGGVEVAAADIDGDDMDEIVTAAGQSGGQHVKIWESDGSLVGEFIVPPGAEATGDVSLAAGDIDGDKNDEIVLADASPREPYVRIFGGDGAKKGEFLAIDPRFRGGLNLAVRDLDGDGRGEIIVAPNGGGGPHVHVYAADGRVLGQFFAAEESYRGGMLVGAGTFGETGAGIVTLPAESLAIGGVDARKYILIDISEQRLRAYEYGKLVRTFLVATGMKGWATPTGDFKVLDKPFKVHYAAYYGANHPWNYDLGVIPYNLKFYPKIYIHYAPWRKVFGVPGSHGCVNVDRANAEWIYGWADKGTPVTVQH